MPKRVDLVADIEAQAAFLEECGAGFLIGVKPRRPAVPPPAASGSGPLRSERLRRALETPRSAPPASLPEFTYESFDKLVETIRGCTRCALGRLRTQAVPGEGSVTTELMFVGEGPGRDEDLQGRPFVGRAGQLLRKIIAAMGFREDEVYITNVVKCRPPENRPPHRDEAEACSPYLLQQIAYIRPKVIVTLGATPTSFFLPMYRSMTATRGHFGEFLGLPVMPTFHPSYLVRNEGNRELKRMVWGDMQKVMALLGRK
ncbi:MAG: uracil-DNA glycosylase [Candidatus Aminicenantes bacterium]|nr:uracil-DNA glycosylase [Candidatus Aminicenantes bacterium]